VSFWFQDLPRSAPAFSPLSSLDRVLLSREAERFLLALLGPWRVRSACSQLRGMLGCGAAPKPDPEEVLPCAWLLWRFASLLGPVCGRQAALDLADDNRFCSLHLGSALRFVAEGSRQPATSIHRSMRSQTPSYNFDNVSISLPAKVRGSEAEEEWQEVDWVVWSSGDVSVDAESFLLVFKPTGGGSVKAKPLGSLIRAAAVTGNSTDEQPKTFIVTTSESLHRMYRLTFASAKPAAEFSRIAERAEAAHEASAPSKDTRGAGDASAEANA
ncbi:unnamed protein product, partial [Polarella glacialis]